MTMRALARFFRRLFGSSRTRRSRRITILLALMFAAASLGAQTTGSSIQDNSFLIEEAYNQDAGVVQHIQTFSRATRGGDFVYAFTQEWPAPGVKHQLSYTLPLLQLDGERGAGDVALNYRYQWIGDSSTRVAVSPRFTLLVPTGSRRRGFGSGGTGVQIMLPVSIVITPSIVAHTNLGATITPSTDDRVITAGQSIVWLTNSRFNVLVETLWNRTSHRGSGDSQFTVSPGIRWSYNRPGDLQIVPGIAFPITGREKSVFLYLSFEHPFRH
ncbi:MAG: hypothetical protein JWO97_2175 [Acidobacteria bacterium]|nr:hypothetical protein [Acidobacteriota bacterium]